jgi:hypothetical protein
LLDDLFLLDESSRTSQYSDPHDSPLMRSGPDQELRIRPSVICRWGSLTDDGRVIAIAIAVGLETDPTPGGRRGAVPEPAGTVDSNGIDTS